MLEYLAYLWARDITEETVGDRRRVLSEVLSGAREPHREPQRGRRRAARALHALADRLEPASNRAPSLRRSA